MIPFFLIAITILALPFLIAIGFFHLVGAGLENLGLSPESATLLLVLIVIGSFINIPLGTRRVVMGEERRFFGLVKRSVPVAQGVSINAGGALIPLAISLYLFPQLPFQETLLAALLMTGVSRAFSRYIPSRGVALSPLLPALFAVVFAFLLAPQDAASVAFVSGVWGVLVGADLLRLPFIIRDARGVLVIGGGGVFDGIFFIGILSALIGGL